MKKGLCELVFILDRSGSMGGLEADTIGGFNSLIEKQKKQEGECLVSTVLFDNASELIHDRVPLDRISPMTEKEYYVRGCTALLDAVGETLERISLVHRYARQEDVPEKTMFIITTDGMENASIRYGAEKVKALIEDKKSRGWEFLFLGANIDAVSVAGGMGISADRAVKFKSDKRGTAINYSTVGDAVCAMRCNAPLSASWKQDIEDYLAESEKK